MAETKDKLVTVESLGDLHEYNEMAYSNINHAHSKIQDSQSGADITICYSRDDLPTASYIGAWDGYELTSIAPNNLMTTLFASGNAILSSYQYGDTLPPAGNVGRIFFKRITE